MDRILQQVLDFWFIEAGREKWFNGGETFDEQLRSLWLDHYHSALDGKLNDWRQSAKGMLGLCLLWDQFPRNAFRGTPRAFATDYLALDVAREVQVRRLDEELNEDEKNFVYMPFMHSENSGEQARCIALFHELERENSVHYAVLHTHVFENFKRFPGRNQALGRQTTEREAAFLASEAGGAF